MLREQREIGTGSRIPQTNAAQSGTYGSCNALALRYHQTDLTRDDMLRTAGKLAPLTTLLALGCLSDELGISPGPAPNLQCTIPTSKLFDGGVGRDGIPALDQPAVEQIASADFNDLTRVLGVVINGEARAYPMPILWWHEIVNDVVGGEPIVVSYCPLTGSGLAFDRVVNGSTRSFGVSGLLFENNLIMFDRQTESLWNQLLLGSQCGPDRGADLQRIPVLETTIGHWRFLYPSSSIVRRDTGHDKPYGAYPYGNYDLRDNGTTLFPSSPWNRERAPKELVLGIHEGAESAAYPLEVLEEMGDVVAMNDSVGGRPVLVTYHDASSTAVGYDRRVNGQLLTFAVSDSAAFRLTDAETGSLWNPRGEAIGGPLQGSRLTQLEDAYTLFWFAWSVFHPDTRIAAP